MTADPDTQLSVSELLNSTASMSISIMNVDTGPQLSVSELLISISTLPRESQVKISTVVGAIVADAACCPLQWCYYQRDMPEIYHWENGETVILDVEHPAFYPTSLSPYFTLPTGASSCYGDETRTCLAALADKEGVLDLPHVTRKVQAMFGAPDSPYQVARALRNTVFGKPVPGPWINTRVIRSLRGMDCEADPPGDKTSEDDGLAICLPAFLINYAGEDAQNAAKLLSCNPLVLNHLKVQTRIINNFIKGVPNPIDEAKEVFKDELPEIFEEITKVEDKFAEDLPSGESDPQVLLQTVMDQLINFGLVSPLPESFQSALPFLLNSLPFSKKFSYAVETNMIAGGDSCTRAIFIGACLGAKFGIEGIPLEWIEKVDGIEKILKNAIKVYA